MSGKYSDIANKTREIFTAQHKNYAKDDEIFQRFLRVARDPSFYALPGDYFKEISVLDAGCGNTGYFQVAMHELGAAKITCLDLGTEWMPSLRAVTTKHGVPEKKIECVDGTITALPFENESFDFVASIGVIMHLESIAESEIAIREMARVTRVGGHLYVYVGIDKPGLVDEYIVPALRNAYKNNKEFQEYVDQLSPERVRSDIRDCYMSAAAHDPAITPEFVDAALRLFTLDSSTFLQDLLQVPMQQAPKLSAEWAKGILESAGFGEIERVPERYWQRSDFRKFLAPLHYRRDVPLAKLLYGGGHIKLSAKKTRIT